LTPSFGPIDGGTTVTVWGSMPEIHDIKQCSFAINYIKFIGFNFKKIQNSYKNILFKDAKTRLLLLIHSILEKEGLSGNNMSLPNYLTQKDIAQLICITRQSVISLLKELEKDGILNYSQKEIFVVDYKKLKEMIENVK
jgi:CRP/FNR family transcriptional regulator